MTERKGDPDKRLAFVLLRYFKYWDQADLAREARISPGQISVYDQGRRTVPDDVLERTAKAAGLPASLLPFLLEAIRAFRLLAEGTWKIGRVLGGGLATDLLDLGHSIAEAVTLPAPPPEGSSRSPDAEREAARLLWDRIRSRPPGHREALVEEDEDYRTWALCERVAAESLEAVGADPKEALQLAELAVHIAEHCSGSEPWRWRLQGYAGIHRANALRACGDLPASREALARAETLWEAGAADGSDLHEALRLGQPLVLEPDCEGRAWK